MTAQASSQHGGGNIIVVYVVGPYLYYQATLELISLDYRSDILFSLCIEYHQGREIWV